MISHVLTVLISTALGQAEVVPPSGVAVLDVPEAVQQLADAEFHIPRQAKELWQQDDGLPAPDDPRFAETAAGFLAQHPVPSVDQQKRVLWDTGKSASRQLKCLA